MRPDGLRAVEGTGEVHPEVAFPQIQTLIVDLPHVVQRARVVHQDVDGAELLDRSRHDGIDLVAVGHVALDRGRAAPQSLNLRRGRLRENESLRSRHRRENAVGVRLVRFRSRLHEQIGDHNVRAGPGEGERVGPPESTGSAGDERDPAGEVDLETHGTTLRQSLRGRKISFAITSRWICDVPS